MKTAYVFPGQGSQFPGMAKDLYENNPTAREMLEKANEILGFRITDIMFEGSAEDLKQTKVTQPAIFLHSVVLAACLPDFKPDMVAGHSLGEFSALVAAGAMNFEEGLRLDYERIISVDSAAPSRLGELFYRLHKDIDIMRGLADTDIDKAIFYSLTYTINKLVSLKTSIHPDTVDAYNEIVIKHKQESNWFEF